MGNPNQYLNNLYHDLVANSPQTISLDIPSDLGNGSISQAVTKRGVILSDWKVLYKEDMNVWGVNREEYIQIIFCMNEGMSWGITNHREDVQIQKGESCIYKGHGGTEYACYAKHCDFHFKNIKIPMRYFSSILEDYFEEQEIIAYENKLLKTVSKVKITANMERILAELKDFSLYRGGLSHLYLDSKLLELVSIYLSEVLELGILSSDKISVSKTDRDSLWEIKRMIDGQLAYAPTCEQLAKKAHMSVSKLSKGFSALFGMPIHSYIIDQRLEKAAELLVATDLPINHIALSVGYTKSSNFASAFRNKYGVIPKKYKREGKVN
ncbi:MAG: AraC family transcriptional regulator [Lachnospiraceae bacterium]